MATALAIRHVLFEDLDELEPLLRSRGLSVGYAEAAAGLNGIDPLAPDLLVVLGGPIGVYQEADYPCVRRVLSLLQPRLAADRPTLGICLGAQLMACALGAPVYAGPAKEIGWAPLTLTASGRSSCLSALQDASGIPVLHWHGDTFDLPQDAVCLASTASCANQAFTWRRRALALQFHLEVSALGLERWYIGHAFELASTAGITINELRSDAERYAPTLKHAARTCLHTWLDTVGL